VAVRKRDLNRIIADRRGRLRARLRLEHRQGSSRRGARAGKSTFSYPLVIARSTRTLLAEICEIVVTRVTV
jgi:hypothetical protein